MKPIPYLLSSRSRRAAALFLCFCASLSPAAARTRKPPAAPLWATAYYISGDADSGRMPLAKIDFTALTHLIHFCVFPNADGTLGQTITPAQSSAVLQAAHAAGCKVLISMGTDEGGVKLHSAVNEEHRAALVQSLTQFAVTRGYDGIDLDYEPLEDADLPNYTAFVTDLRKAMDAAKPGMLLAAAVASEPKTFATLQAKFDQINLMTYDLSGKYEDFKSWYNSSLYGDPSHVMENGKPYPSADDMVKQFLQAGVAPSKLGMGVGFYGYIWSGISGPRQTIKDVKNLTIDDGADYRMIMDQYYQPSRYHWDKTALAPYLEIDAASPGDRKFISYDDERLCAAKVAYARRERLGGVMIWELGAGYRDSQPEGGKDVLLQAIKTARLDPSINDPRRVNVSHK